MQIKIINTDFTVCKVEDFTQVNFDDEFVFISKTDEENSLVCSSGFTPQNTTEYEKGWRCFRIEGVLDFSLVGILAKISSLLADNLIPIYAVSTFNTDYILVKKEHFDKAILTLSQNGYNIV